MFYKTETYYATLHEMNSAPANRRQPGPSLRISPRPYFPKIIYVAIGVEMGTEPGCLVPHSFHLGMWRDGERRGKRAWDHLLSLPHEHLSWGRNLEDSLTMKASSLDNGFAPEDFSFCVFHARSSKATYQNVAKKKTKPKSQTTIPNNQWLGVPVP